MIDYLWMPATKPKCSCQDYISIFGIKAWGIGILIRWKHRDSTWRGWWREAHIELRRCKQ